MKQARKNPDFPSSPLVFGPRITQTCEHAVALEWLLTNGLGDFASGTVAGPATRRTHGLFTAAGAPGRRPMLLLAALDVTLEREGERYALSCHQFADSRHPEGFRFCAEFRADPLPQWRYEAPGAGLTYRLLMPRGRRCVVCAWQMAPDAETGPWRLRVRPLMAWREADALTQANNSVNMALTAREEGFSLTPYPGCPEMFCDCPGAEVLPDPCWYYRFEHKWDIALGRDAREDLFSPCVLSYTLAPGSTAAFCAGLEPQDTRADDLARADISSPVAPLRGLEDDPVADVLARAAERFTVRGGDGKIHLLTGFPAATGSARATLTALPGLLLCARRLDEARSVLQHIADELAVNTDTARLNDLPLWFIRAGEQYVDHSRDWDFLRDSLAPAAETLMLRYLKNDTPHGFRLAPDGLLASTGRSQALTWMDARIENWPVTPRAGKPVEVNALWHHALGLLVRWSRRRGHAESGQKFGRLLDLCARSFRLRFWNESTGGLYDVVDTDEQGAPSQAIRPNQIFAVSLPSDLLDRRQAEGVLRLVENRLLTPVGLRTLSLEDRSFRPRYAGSAVERSGARHQGSVFPWLLGAYVDAVFRVHGRTDRAYGRAEACLETLLGEHLREGCVGQVAELFHGAAPHTPQGLFAHAPALGELIRIYTEIKGRLW